MSRPRVFVSSTYYDLKHIRSSLEIFIESLGFESILSEKGQIAYSPDIPLDESCYIEVGNIDIFIIIIGGRYGSEKSISKEKKEKQFFDQYDSITKQEYKTAVDKDVPTYILIEKSVFSEFEIFLKNKNNQSINYVHVDSVNIFHLIEDILSQPRNNPVHHFDRYSDIEVWLREQWARLFQELLNQRSKQIQIASLATQVNTLEEINRTLKRYLEEVISKVSPDDSARLIEDESKRLEDVKKAVLLKNTEFYTTFFSESNIPIDEICHTVTDSISVEDLIENKMPLLISHSYDISSRIAEKLTNEARSVLGLNTLELKNKEKEFLHIVNESSLIGQIIV